jgi:hypothetical protein
MTTFLNKITRYFKENLGVDYTDYYTVQKDPKTGKYAIYDRDGFVVRSYTRRTDAVRGAERNGFTLV